MENYSYHVQKTDTEVYQIFEKQGILKLLDDDYGDLHGMGMGLW